MPLFYTNIRIDGQFAEDEQGQDFPSLDDAFTDAIGAAREIMADRMLTGRLAMHSVIEIMNSARELVSTFHFVTALKPG